MRHRLFALCFAAILQTGLGIVLASPAGVTAADQQKVTVQGRVTDTSGEPLAGVNVTVKGVTRGTVTNLDGLFTIEISTGEVLRFSFIGFKDEEVTPKGSRLIKVVMREDAEALDEVVVIGYGTSRKKDITGAMVSVKADELNAVTSSSVNQMLQGKVTGMSAIQSSAQPGAGISINIRGAVSPNGDNTPLYVIDGVPLQNYSTAEPELFGYDYKTGVDRDPLNSINPNDIESIEVLKDASAAAIYGASAANGVILITTKTGKTGKAKVDYSSTLTLQIRKAFPEVLNAQQFREQTNFWNKEYYLYNNGMGVYGDNEIDLSGWTPIFSDVTGYTADTKWIDEVSRQGYIIDQNVSVNGGSEKTHYFFSYNFYDNVGMLKQSGYRRHNIRMNLDQEFSKRVKGGIKINYSNNTANSTSVGSAGNGDNMMLNVLRYAPDIPVKDEDGNYSKSYSVLINNPVSYTEIEDKTVTDRVVITPTIEVKILDGLSIHGSGVSTSSQAHESSISL